MNAASRLDASRLEPLLALAQVHLKQGKPDQAFDQFSRAIALKPDLAALYRGRADVQLARKNPTAAERSSALHDLEQAIRLEQPNNRVLAGDHAKRARLLALEHRDAEALAACDAAIKISPDFEDAHRLRIDLLREQKQYDEINRSCSALIARGKPSAKFYELRALARSELKDFPGAIDDLTYAIALRPEQAALLSQRGWLYIVADAPRLALHDFEAALRLDPSGADHLQRSRFGSPAIWRAPRSRRRRREGPLSGQARPAALLPRSEGLRPGRRRGRRRGIQERAREPDLESTLPGARGDTHRRCAQADARSGARGVLARRHRDRPIAQSAPPPFLVSGALQRSSSQESFGEHTGTVAEDRARVRDLNPFRVDLLHGCAIMIPYRAKAAAGFPRRPPRRRERAAACLADLSRVHFRYRPRLEFMEDRTLLSTFLVNTTADSGPGSLRQAILDSNAATGGTSTIDFAIPGQGVQTIAPISPLPAITKSVLIDGFSQPGYAGTPLIELSGSQAGSARRPDHHRLGRDRPRPGHQRLLPGRRHPHHREPARPAT